MARPILVELSFLAKAPERCRIRVGGWLSQRLKGKLKITNRISNQLNAFSFFKLNNLGVLVTQIDLQSFDAETFIFCFPENQNHAPLPRYCALYDPSRQQYKVILLVAVLLNPRTVKITSIRCPCAVKGELHKAMECQLSAIGLL